MTSFKPKPRRHSRCAQVEGLPRDATSNEVRDYFGSCGEVVAVALARGDGQLIAKGRERERIVAALDAAIATMQKAAMEVRLRGGY